MTPIEPRSSFPDPQHGADENTQAPAQLPTAQPLGEDEAGSHDRGTTLTQAKTKPPVSTAQSAATRHPRAVWQAVSIEAWERFSFYGMQAILAYYLYYATTEGGMGIAKTEATALVGAYGALLYLCTFAGGWISDRLLGAEKTLLLGASMLVVGHLTLSFYHPVLGLATGLTLIGVGSGLLKTSAITVIGTIYTPAPEASAEVQTSINNHRESSFQIFYFGIQLAAILGPLLTGWLMLHYGFHAGFAAAAVLMIIGMAIYVAGRGAAFRDLPEETVHSLRNPVQPVNPVKGWGIVALGALVLACVVSLPATGAISAARMSNFLLIAVLSVAAAMLIHMFASHKVTAYERAGLHQYLPLFFSSCAFWALMNQSFGVLAVYADTRLDRMVFGFEVPAAWTQSLNPLFVVTLSIPLAYLWIKLGERSPHPAAKMSVGTAIMGASMFTYLPFAGGGENSTPFMVLAFAIFVGACAELLCGPVGMAATAMFAPKAFRTRFSALFFLSMAAGTAAAGSFSTFYDPTSAHAERSYFLTVGFVAILIGIVTLIWTRVARRLAN